MPKNNPVVEIRHIGVIDEILITRDGCFVRLRDYFPDRRNQGALYANMMKVGDDVAADIRRGMVFIETTDGAQEVGLMFDEQSEFDDPEEGVGFVEMTSVDRAIIDASRPDADAGPVFLANLVDPTP